MPAILLLGTLSADKGTLSALAKSHGFEAFVATDIEAGLKAASTHAVSTIFVDSGADLPTLFEGLRAAKITAPVIVLGPSQPAANAAKAIRMGATEYLSSPSNKAVLSPVFESLMPENPKGVIAGDPKTMDLITNAKRFANSGATVLLRGESGTGKEVFSRFVHENSPRVNKAFISVNCAAIPENLLESELFGHVKGAFSGALGDKPGKFKLADGGTLLLDEISEMDLGLQAKLLRAIQERVIDPVGSTSSVPVDIRLIATTNRALEKEVEEGKFREDLYFRLNVVMLEIPALRERPGDILPLAQFFAEKYGSQNGVKDIKIDKAAADKLLGCYWKGNVRELENTVHRAVLMMGTDTTMNADHIMISPMSASRTVESKPEANKAPSGNAAAGAYAAAGGMFEGGTGANRPASRMVGHTMEEVERDLILSTLNYCEGDRRYAADILGITIKQLRDKLTRYETSQSASAAREETPQEATS
jgi:two-component system response regulator FlrC